MEGWDAPASDVEQTRDIRADDDVEGSGAEVSAE